MVTEIEVRAALDQVTHPTFGLSLIALNMVRTSACERWSDRGRSGDARSVPRLRGEVAAALGEYAEAEAHFRRAIEVADAQGAITWAQRAVQSLGRWRGRDRSGPAWPVAR